MVGSLMYRIAFSCSSIAFCNEAPSLALISSDFRFYGNIVGVNAAHRATTVESPTNNWQCENTEFKSDIFEISNSSLIADHNPFKAGHQKNRVF